MRRAIISFMLLMCFSTLLSGIAEAQTVPSWRQNLFRTASATRKTPPNLLRGLTYNLGGGGSPHPCSTSPQPGLYSSLGYESGTLVSVRHEGYMDEELSTVPIICAHSLIAEENTWASSPQGDTLPLVRNNLLDGELFGYALPVEAFADPGVWKIAVQDTDGSYFEQYIEILPPSNPFFATFSLSEFVDDSYYTPFLGTETPVMLVGGFQPNEGVAALFFNVSDDFGYSDYVFEVNEAGYALLDFSQDDPIDFPEYLIGQYGSIVRVSFDGLAATVTDSGVQVYHMLYFITDDPSGQTTDEVIAQWLYDSLWGAENGGGANPGVDTSLCTRAPQDMLSGYSQGRVTPGDPNNIRDAPESENILGQIPGGAVFNILGGPVCGAGTNLRWWYVEYNGVVGWTADGRDGVPWLVPAG